MKAENMLQLIPFINQGLWDAQMEKNKVLDKSFDRPSAALKIRLAIPGCVF